MSSSEEYSRFLDSHIEAMSIEPDTIFSKEKPFVVPFASHKFVINLCNDVSRVLMEDPIMLELDENLVVVGDLHGHLMDLYRIIRKCDLPPNSTYLFLGDLVDRGEFSIETTCLVLTLKLLFPRHVYIIRGNHEFGTSSKNAGLFNEVVAVYPNTNVYEAMIECFATIPLAARLSQKILCIHAGLSPGLQALSQITSIQRPISGYDDPIVCGLVWSDPRDSLDGFTNSPRGSGFLFGKEATITFLRENNLDLLIRGHECVKNGFQAKFSNRILTVFSASNYCGQSENNGAVLLIEKGGKIKTKTFPFTEYLRRKDAKFFKIESKEPLNWIFNTMTPNFPSFDMNLSNISKSIDDIDQFHNASIRKTEGIIAKQPLFCLARRRTRASSKVTESLHIAKILLPRVN